MGEYIKFDPRTVATPATPATPATRTDEESIYPQEKQRDMAYVALHEPDETPCDSSATPATRGTESSKSSRESHPDACADSPAREGGESKSSKSSKSSRVLFLYGVFPGAEDGRALDGTYVCTNPQTGQRFITYLYRCPECGGTNWGPCLNTPEVWCCLTCAVNIVGS